MNNLLFESYGFHRYHAVPALKALALARADFYSGVLRHIPDSKQPSRPGKAFRRGNALLRCLSDYESHGFQFIDYASALTDSDHQGWYSRSGDTSETYRPAVFTMRWKNGKLAAFAGYVYMWDDEPVSPGCAILECSPVRVFDRDIGVDDLDGALSDVAERADRVAMDSATEARERDAAWRAGKCYTRCRDEIGRMRREMVEVARAARDNVKANTVICRVLREKVCELRSTIRELVIECRSLANGSSDRDSTLMFDVDDADFRAAFNQGADRAVLA